jgi:uncharacterized protein
MARIFCFHSYFFFESLKGTSTLSVGVVYRKKCNSMPLGTLEMMLVGVIAIVLVIIIGAIIWYVFQLHLYAYAWGLNMPPPAHRIKIDYNTLIPMSDGVKLVADIYRPKMDGKFPVIVMRTPYAKGNTEHSYPLIATIFSCQGYVVIIQDVRGKYGSEGIFIPFLNEEQDGQDTVNWASEQEWSNGKVALMGFSYLGTCAWLTTLNGPKSLKAVVPMFCCQNAYTGWIDGGVPYLKDILMWLLRHHGRKGREVPHSEVDDIILQLPVLQFDKRIKDGIDTFKSWMYHLHEDEYWQIYSVNHRRHEIDVPALFVAGWFDRFVNNTVNDYYKTANTSPDLKTKESRLVIGPWGHKPTTEFPDFNFGTDARFRHQFRTMLKWYDHWLKGAKAEFDHRKPIEYFMMGKNEWRQTESWPPPGVCEEKWYLSNQGVANTFSGSGTLTTSKPDEQVTDTYVYDPEFPAPSIGNKMLYGNQTDGPRDQSVLYKRQDILYYHTEPFEEDFEVAGPISVVLYLSSSAVDTDFAAKICDLHPNGKSYFLANGFQRMRFLDSVKATHGIEADKVYRLELMIGQTAHTFLKGHCIQLQVSSSDFPNHERNLNTGGSNEGDSEEVTATQTVYLGGIYDSHVILPRLS